VCRSLSTTRRTGARELLAHLGGQRGQAGVEAQELGVDHVGGAAAQRGDRGGDLGGALGREVGLRLRDTSSCARATAMPRAPSPSRVCSVARSIRRTSGQRGDGGVDVVRQPEVADRERAPVAGHHGLDGHHRADRARAGHQQVSGRDLGGERLERGPRGRACRARR
jgi:hypothetical protein